MSTSTSTADVGAGSLRSSPGASVVPRARVYFASDTRRAIQTVLGLIWLLDGALQFQSFMYGKGFISMLTAMTAGQLDPFNHAVSFVVNCESQDEIDRYWNALIEGGSAEQCGWLKDRFGLSWQIVPVVMVKMMSDPDRAKAKRATDAMLKMVKLDIAKLTAAFEGKS